MEFEERLRKRLDQIGMSQIELSKKTNITKSQISNYVTGKQKPDIFNLALICDATNTSADYYLGIKSVMTINR